MNSSSPYLLADFRADLRSVIYLVPFEPDDHPRQFLVDVEDAVEEFLDETRERLSIASPLHYSLFMHKRTKSLEITWEPSSRAALEVALGQA